LADPTRQPVIDFCVTRTGAFCPIGWVDLDRMAAAFAFQTTPLALEMID
jgi:hypothetical protein